MFEQLSNLVRQFGGEAVVNNPAVPNEHNESVMSEASSSIMDGLKNMVSNGNISDLAGMFQGTNASDTSNPVVQNLIEQVSGNLGSKFGLSTEASTGVANNLIPQVLGGLVNKAKDPNDSSFNVSDIVDSISGGNGGGIMDAISNYGGQFGLDQDGDGKVGMSDAVAAVTKKSGGLGGLLGKLFGR
jgi:hypothetical protein